MTLAQRIAQPMYGCYYGIKNQVQRTDVKPKSNIQVVRKIIGARA